MAKNSPEVKKELPTIDLVRYNLGNKYLAAVTNFYDGDKSAAMRFMTGYVDHIRRNPKLLECSPMSLINSAMMIASFRFTPSSTAGEAYIIPYAGDATFQMGYQGYVVLFYRAGVRAINAEIVRENDEFSLENGIPTHKVDPRKGKEARGKAIGAYVRVVLPSGEPTYKYMNGEDIITHAKRFSKAFNKPDSPWKEENDPELNMWKKTVLLQMKSTLPKNSELIRAMEEDFKDSVIHDRLEAATKESQGLTMGSLAEKDTTDEKAKKPIEDGNGASAESGAGKGDGDKEDRGLPA